MAERRNIKAIPEPKFVKPIPIEAIFISEQNVRYEERRVGLDELKASIENYGMLQPVVVIEIKPDREYELVIGQRRYYACEALGVDKIWAAIYPESAFDEQQKLILSLSENIQRRPIRKGEEIRAITSLYDDFESMREVAEVLGISITKVSQSVKIERLVSDEALELLNANKISKTDIIRIIEMANGDENRIDEMIKKLVKVVKEGEYAARQKTRVRDALIENPEATEEELKEKAEEQKYTERLIIDLPISIINGLKEAAEKAETEHKDLILNIIENWLAERGYL